MSASTSFADFTTMYNRIVTDNPGHVVTTSWGGCEAGVATATQQADDDIFANANAIGQSWFAASGDHGSLDCSNTLSVDNPANSPHVIGVGGTTATCSSGLTSQTPGCGGYGSETGWNGSGGGVSELFTRPAFQSGCGVPPGPTRLVPDVALEADTTPGDYVLKNGSWFIVGGTSGAAPQWAGYVAELNQRTGGGGFGNPGALLYSLCGTAAYHDVLAGSNGTYAAGPGYDLVTGLGTIHASDFLLLAAPATTTTASTSPTTTSTTSTSTSTASSSTATSSTVTTSTASTSTTTGTTTTTLQCGDVDGNQTLNIGDPLAIAQFLSGQQMCGQGQFSHPELCDVTGPPGCDIGDALRIAQCLAGQVSCTTSCARSCPASCPPSSCP
jgi:subtilase family serine protease